MEIAKLLEGLDEAQAEQTLRGILIENTQDAEALRLLDELYERMGNHAQQADVLDMRIASEPAADARAALIARLATLKLKHVQDVGGALELLRRGVGDAPQAVELRRALEALTERVRGTPVVVAASQLLESVLRAQNDLAAVPNVVELRLALETDREARACALLDVAQLQERIGQPSIGFMTICRALKELPEDEGIRSEAERLAFATDNAEGLALVYEDIIDTLEQGPIRVALMRRVAKLSEEAGASPAESRARLAAAVDAGAEDVATLEDLVRLTREQGATPELSRALGRLMAAAAREQRADVARQAGIEKIDVDEVVGDVDGALATARALYAQDPADTLICSTLERLLEGAAKWIELDGVLAKTAKEAGTPDQQGQAFARLAFMRLEHRRDVAGAVEALRGLAAANPTSDSVVALGLRLVLMLSSDNGPEAQQWRTEIAELLEPRLEAARAWTDLAPILRLRLDACREPAERRRLYGRIVDVEEHHLERPDQAMLTLARSLSENPGDTALRERAERMSVKLHDLDSLLGIYEDILETLAHEDPNRFTYALRAAELYEGGLGEPLKAAGFYELALQTPAARSLAAAERDKLVDRVERLMRAVSEYAKLVAVLKRKADLAGDEAAARQAMFEAASIELHKIKDFKAAAGTLAALLEKAPEDLQVIRALCEATEQLGLWGELASLLERELALLGPKDGVRAIQVRFKLGTVLDQHLNRADDALAHFQAILHDEPDHKDTRQYLEGRLTQRQTGKFDSAVFLTESYERTGDWKRAVEVLQAQLPDLEKRSARKEVHELLLRIAELQERKLGNPGLAFATLCRAMKNDPGDRALRERLNALAAANELSDELVDIYEEEASGAESEGRQAVAAELRDAAADLCAGRLEDLSRAIRIHETTLESEPGRTASLQALASLYARAGRFVDAEKVLRRQLVFEEDPAARLPLLVALSDCLVDKLGRAEDAQPLLEEARRHDPANVEVRRLLIDLREAQGQVEELRALLTEEVDACQASGDHAHLAQARRRLAILLADELNDVAAAIPLWEELRAQEVKQGNVSARDVSFKTLERLYNAAGRYVELRQLYETALKVERDPALLSSLTTRLGEVLSLHLGGKEEAAARHLKILELDPQNAASLSALRGLFADLGRFDELAALLRRMTRFVSSPDQLKELRFELAEVLGSRLSKRAESVEAARRVLELEPHTATHLDRLASVLRVNEAWDELVDVLERSVLATEGEARVARLIELARIYEEKLRRPDLAMAAFERALKAAPGHEAAYTQLCRLYTDGKEWQRLVTLKDDRAKRARDTAERVGLLKEVGAIYEERLRQKPLAFLTACRAFREDWDDASLAEWAERLALETDSIDEIVAIYDDALGNLSDGHRIVETHVRIAELSWRHLGAIADAELHYRRALEAEPTNTAAFDGVVALHESQRRWPELIKAFDRRVEQSHDDGARVALLQRLARLLEDSAEDLAAAAATHRRVLALEPSSQATLAALAALFERAGRWQELVEVLQTQERLATSLADRLGVRLRIASVWEQQLQDSEQAIASHRAILDDDPTYIPALEALERLLSAGGRAAELVHVYERRVELATSTDDELVFLFKIAVTSDEALNDAAQAIGAYDRVLEIDRKNLRAVEGLERLLGSTRDWRRLVETYEHHIRLATDPREQVRLHLALGKVEAQELARLDRAEAAFKAVLAIDKGSQDAVHALGALYERKGNWNDALDKLRAEALLLGTSREAVAVHHRIGSIYEQELRDPGAATSAYRTAVEVEPTHLPSLRALGRLALARGDNAEHLQWLREEARHTADPGARTELHTAAGVFLMGTLEDGAQAAAEFEKAVAIAPEHMPAVRPLAELCFSDGRWDRTESLLDVIVQRLDPATEVQELCRQHYRLAYVSEKLGNDQKALRNYQRAHELDATYLPALEGYGAALSRASRWEDAARVYQAILLHHREGLTDAEVVDYHQQIADLQQKTGQADRAIKSLEKALELDPGHPPSLRLLAQIYSADRRFEDAYEVYVRLVPLLFGEDRVQALIETGRMAAADLEDPYRAIDAFEDANRQKPGDKVILESLYKLYREARQAARAVDMLEELVRIEQDEKARVRLNHTLGEVYREELKNDQRALAYFNAALDLDPNYVKSFEAIEAMLTASGSWPTLAESYIAMLKRIPETRAGIKGVLWKNLGDLYRFRLRNLEGATQAYRVIVKMSPDNADATEVLSELLSRNPATLEEATAGFLRVMQMVPDKLPKVLHELLRIALAKQELDRVYIYASILKVLGQATQQELDMLSLYQKQVPSQAKRKMSDKLWEALLVHPQARSPVAVLSATLWRAAGAAVALQPRDFGIDRRRGSEWEQVDLEAPVQSYFVNQLKHVRAVLDTPPFELFQKANSTDPITPLCLAQPTLALGKASPLLADTQARRLWFTIARQLASLRPAYILPRTMGAARFSTLVDVAVKAVDARYPPRGDATEIARFEKALALGGPAVQGALLPPVTELLKARQAINIAPFLEGMEHTSIRAGYLLTGDLELCLELLKQPDPGAVRLAHTAKVKELLLFAVSEEHFELRQRLGLAIGS